MVLVCLTFLLCNFKAFDTIKKQAVMNAKILCVANQKGGVGKTTTAINLSVSLGLLKKKVLLVDIDPQGNAGSGIGIKPEDCQENIYHLLVGEKQIETIIKKTDYPNLYFIPSNINLTGAEIELVNMPERERCLLKGIEKLKHDFEYIIIDCPPSLGLLTLNSLSASDSVLIPLQCEYYALEGLSQLVRTIKLVKTRLNPELVIEGILLTMFDKRNNLSHQVAKEIVKHFSSKLFRVIIPRSVRLAECPSHGKPVFFYDKSSVGTKTYLELARHIINNNGRNVP